LQGQKILQDGDLPRRITVDADGSLSITQVGPDSIGTYQCLVVLGQEMEASEASLQIIGLFFNFNVENKRITLK
jgi:hypothetical protein